MRRLKTLVGAVVLSLSFSQVAFASEPYSTYYYNDKLEPVPSIAGYTPDQVVSGLNNKIGNMSNPSDLVVKDNQCYVADTGNNRIVIYNINNGEMEVSSVVDSFDNSGNEDTFNQPQGLFVHEDGDIYIADTENSRIVVLNDDGTLDRVIDKPEVDVMQGDYMFTPRKIAVDVNDRIYIVASSMTEGLMQLNADGDFLRFFGSNKVKPNITEIFLRKILTDEQREKRVKFIPVEYSNISIDKNGFVYATTLNVKEDQIKKLNYVGENIIRTKGRTKNVYGDISADMPVMIDVASDMHDNVYALDKSTGRIFQYNTLGDMLTVFGGLGDSTGLFKNPVAIDCDENGNVYVLDSVKNNITSFKQTEFGSMVIKANNSYIDGRYTEAMEAWQQVLKMNANYDLAYVGMGNAHLQLKEYEEAMHNFKLGRDRVGYSKAFDKYRTEVLREKFPIIMTSLLVVVAILFATSRIRENLKKRFNKYINA